MKLARDHTLKTAYKILEELDDIGVPVFVTHGNHDKHRKWMTFKHKDKDPKYFIEDKIKELKNVKLLDFSAVKFGDYYLYGVGSKLRGVDLSKGKLKPKYKKYKEMYTKRIEKFFKEIKQRNKIIFLTHEPPMPTKLDLITDKKSPMYGKHAGDYIVYQMIKKYQPRVNICGHIHESKGAIRLGRTPCINIGSEGKYAIISIESKGIRVKFHN